MPKPRLKPEFQSLENSIVDTFIAGCKEWRPDLPYPESASDMQAGARALLRRFDIKQRPIDVPIDSFLADRKQDV